MADKLGEELVEELGQLDERREPWKTTWTEIQEQVVPRRTGFDTDTPERGKRHDGAVYDGTALGALETMVDGLHGNLFSPETNWLAVRCAIEELNDVREVRKWTAIVDRVLLGLFNRSNFYREIREQFRDAGSFGTGTMSCEVDLKRMRFWFRTYHPRCIFLAEDQYGVPDIVFRLFTYTYRQCMQRFGGDDLDEHVVKAAEDNPHKDLLLMHVTKPNPDFDESKADSRSKKVLSYYVDVENRKVIRKSGFDSDPYSPWRFYHNSDEEYGRSPAWDALPDIRMLNAMVKSGNTQVQIAANPPRRVPMELRNKILWQPGANNFYGPGEENRRIEVINPQSALLVEKDLEEQKRRAIERAFMVPFFLLITQADREMTIPELRARQEEKAVQLGPTLTGLNHEVLDRIVDYMFAVCMREGWIPQPPDILIEAAKQSQDGGKLEVDYKGPLAQAAARHWHTDPVRNTIMDVLGVAQSVPAVLDNFDWDWLSREGARGNGLPEEGMVDEKLVAQRRAEQQKQMERQRQMAEMETMGKASPGLGKKAEQGSAMEKIEAGLGRAGRAGA